MALKRRHFTREFKLQVVREVQAGKPVAQAAREHQLHPNLIATWRQAHLRYAERAFAGNGNHYRDEGRIAELQRLIGELTAENDLLKKACCGSRDKFERTAGLESLDVRTDHPRDKSQSSALDRTDVLCFGREPSGVLPQASRRR